MDKTLSEMGYAAIIITIIVSAISIIMNFISTKEITAYKGKIDKDLADQKAASDKEIEALKTDLKLYEGQLSSLHNVRLESIKEFYKLLITLKSAMERFVSPRMAGQDPVENERVRQSISDEMNKSYQEYYNYLLINKIYFTEELASRLTKISDNYHSAIWDYNEYNFLTGFGVEPRVAFKETQEKRDAAIKIIRDEMPKPIQEIENEFRKILGVK